MGNVCAPDCMDGSMHKERVAEATFDLDSEHVSTYPSVKRSSQSDLPRLFGSKQSIDKASLTTQSARNSRVSKDLFSQPPVSVREPVDAEAQRTPVNESPLQADDFIGSWSYILPEGESALYRIAWEGDELIFYEETAQHRGVLTQKGEWFMAALEDTSDGEVQGYIQLSMHISGGLLSNCRPQEDAPWGRDIVGQRATQHTDVISESEVEATEEPVAEPPREAIRKSVMELQIDRPSLELSFEVKGEIKRVVMHRRPLGAEFAKGMMGGPTKIKKVHPNSHAVELGMEKGWILKSVGTEDVSKKSLQCAQNALKNATVALPM
jgi:hypothetical protein